MALFETSFIFHSYYKSEHSLHSRLFLLLFLGNINFANYHQVKMWQKSFNQNDYWMQISSKFCCCWTVRWYIFAFLFFMLPGTTWTALLLLIDLVGLITVLFEKRLEPSHTVRKSRNITGQNRSLMYTANILLVKNATFPCVFFPILFQCIKGSENNVKLILEWFLKLPYSMVVSTSIM